MQTAQHNTSGFTLIELIVVFSLMTILSSAGIAAFVNYSRSQQVATSIADIKTTLGTARSRALSQLKVGTCGSSSSLQLQGYEVLFCCSFAGCPTCLRDGNNNTPDYEMNIVCANSDGSGLTRELTYSKKFPDPGVSVANSSNTTATSFFFSSVSAAVTTNGGNQLPQVSITGFGIIKIATVSGSGVIQ